MQIVQSPYVYISQREEGRGEWVGWGGVGMGGTGERGRGGRGLNLEE